MGLNLTTTNMATLTNTLSQIITRLDILLEPEEAAAIMLSEKIHESVTWHDGYLLDGELVARMSRANQKEAGNEQ